MLLYSVIAILNKSFIQNPLSTTNDIFIGNIYIYRKNQQKAYIIMYNIYNLPSSNTCLWIEVVQLI